MTAADVRRSQNRKVIWRGKSYVLTGCVIRLIKGEFVYQAEITEYRENMTTLYYTALEDVEMEE